MPEPKPARLLLLAPPAEIELGQGGQARGGQARIISSSSSVTVGATTGSTSGPNTSASGTEVAAKTNTGTDGFSPALPTFRTIV